MLDLFNILAFRILNVLNANKGFERFTLLKSSRKRSVPLLLLWFVTYSFTEDKCYMQILMAVLLC